MNTRETLKKLVEEALELGIDATLDVEDDDVDGEIERLNRVIEADREELREEAEREKALDRELAAWAAQREQLRGLVAMVEQSLQIELRESGSFYGELRGLEVRVSDHGMPAFGGFSERSGYRHGAADLNFVLGPKHTRESVRAAAAAALKAKRN
mgnify:CR=1 FL=1